MRYRLCNVVHWLHFRFFNGISWLRYRFRNVAHWLHFRFLTVFYGCVIDFAPFFIRCIFVFSTIFYGCVINFATLLICCISVFSTVITTFLHCDTWAFLKRYYKTVLQRFPKSLQKRFKTVVVLPGYVLRTLEGQCYHTK